LPEWLIERGIGETRAALVDSGEIIEARIELDWANAAGTVVAARLVDRGRNGRNAVARDASGVEYLLPRGAPAVTEGAAINVEIARGAIPGSEPWKRPLARVTDESPRQAPPLRGRELPLPTAADELGRAGWNELIDEARSGLVQFDGGELRVSVTPAMTLIDVDGSLDAGELAVRGAGEAAKAIRRLDIGGSIGIDLPTSGSKAARHAAAAAIDEKLLQPFERTAVNGFGFVQIVRPRRRASLIELALDRAAFEARALLRRAAFEPAGPKRLVGHPAVIAVLEVRSDWTEALSLQVGGAIGLRADPALPISGGYAESR
jgi:ribonuclease G